MLRRRVLAASRTCTFDHRKQPGIELQDNSVNEGVAQERDQCVAGFMDVSGAGGVSSGRTLVSDLATFAVKWKIGRDACNDLFRILRAHGVQNIPKDCRTAKKSLRKVVVQPMGLGSYFHFGVEKELVKNISLLKTTSDLVQLKFNVDGLPLYNSSPIDFWPILCQACVGGQWSHVFPVALYCGKSKPASVEDFLREFIEECTSIVENGFYIKGEAFQVEIHSFVCDAPARQFLKKVISHSGYFSCERCVVRGVTGVKFVDTNCTERTDEMYRAHLYESHQNSASISPLVELPIDMIAHFPLDYMHLVLLGVVKRLLRLWLGTTDFKVTSFSTNFRLNARVTGPAIEERIRFCTQYISSEFQRKPRQFDENKWFKAKEYRVLLCYTFPFIFRSIFNNPEVYDHFLLLVVAFRVMLGMKPTQNLVKYVKDLLVRFVKDVEKLYGTIHMTYSVHNLIHVPSDYEKFGVLDNISAFPFESFMLKLKNYVKRPGQELQQVVNRRHEETLLDVCPESSAKSVEMTKEHNDGPLGRFDASLVSNQYGRVVYNGRKFSNCSRDCFVCVGDKFGRIVNFIRIDDKLYTAVRYFQSAVDFFAYPCPSKNVGIVRCSNLLNEIVAVDLQTVEKCVAFPMPGESFYVCKLLHETLMSNH